MYYKDEKKKGAIITVIIEIITLIIVSIMIYLSIIIYRVLEGVNMKKGMDESGIILSTVFKTLIVLMCIGALIVIPKIGKDNVQIMKEKVSTIESIDCNSIDCNGLFGSYNSYWTVTKMKEQPEIIYYEMGKKDGLISTIFGMVLFGMVMCGLAILIDKMKKKEKMMENNKKSKKIIR